MYGYESVEDHMFSEANERRVNVLDKMNAHTKKIIILTYGADQLAKVLVTEDH